MNKKPNKPPKANSENRVGLGSLLGKQAGEDPRRQPIERRQELSDFGDLPLDKLPSTREKEGIDARQARRLATAHKAFIREFCKPNELNIDWEHLKEERKIFTVTDRGFIYVPSFQFDEKGTPRPAIARVIQILGKDTSDWGLALWFTATSGRLDGKRPVDLLSSHPDDVVQAAEQEAAELVF